MKTIGQTLRAAREARGEAMWQPCGAVGLDTGLLSRIERDIRLPTQKQCAAFAEYYGLDKKELEAQRIAADYWRKYGEYPEAVRAAGMIRERAATYSVKRKGSGK